VLALGPDFLAIAREVQGKRIESGCTPSNS